MEYMEILLFASGMIIWAFFMFMYLDLKHTVSNETIEGVYKNDKLYRVFRKIIEKHHPEIIEKCKEL